MTISDEIQIDFVRIAWQVILNSVGLKANRYCKMRYVILPVYIIIYISTFVQTETNNKQKKLFLIDIGILKSPINSRIMAILTKNNLKTYF